MTTTQDDRATAPATPVEFGSGVLYRCQLFTPTEAEEIVAAVDRLPSSLRRNVWSTLGGGMSTIGEPLYRNRERLDYYTRCARRDNRRLYRHFRFAHDAVAAFFERRYQAPVVFAEELAVPGFHVFEYQRAGAHDGGSWHFDMLHQQVPYFVANAGEVAGVVNFTLPVEVPGGGTGMDLCDDEPGAVHLGTGTPVRAAYEPGVLVFTEREYWHRIGGSTCLRDGERRVTLQGHGVHFRGRWVLFW
jgi:hypothetical protein